MLNPVLDLSVLSGRQTAVPVSRDRARSAVLERFDLASARRQFSLDEAAAQRTERAARSSEKPVASRKTEPERPATQDRPTQARESTSPSRAEKPRRAEDSRATDASERSGPNRQADAKNAPAKATESTQKSDAKEGAEPKASSEAENPEAAAAAETQSEAAAAQPTPQIVPAVAVTAKPAVLPQEAAASAQPAAPDAVAPSAPAAEQTVGAEGITGSVATTPGEAPHADATKTGETAGPRFSAMLGDAAAAAPQAAAAPDPTAALAKPEGVAHAARTAEAAPTAAATPSQPTTPPVPLGAVPMTIALRSLQDMNRFDIRLDPVELGRIDVRLDIDRESGTVSADLVVDRPSTLALLQRDADALQQALSQAGLDASGGVSLSLRDGTGGQNQGDEQSGRQASAGQARRQAEPTETIDPGPMRALRLSGVDLRI